ncbi:hypothetical protein [Profundibacter sp.]
MTPLVNLHILARRYTQLSKSAYFDPAFKDFARRTVDATQHVLDNARNYPDGVIRQFEQHVWRVMQFVRGSRSNDAPHETQYVLRKALKEWILEEVLVSSASLEEFSFFLNTADLWDFINKSLNDFNKQKYKPLVVQIGAPEAFKHRPIFCVPLFHELGHFVDHHYKISEFSLLQTPPAQTPDGMHQDYWRAINLRHRMEHFADLFGSCYCGEAGNKSLLAIAPDHSASPTHPATIRRVEIVDDFLNNRQNDMVDLLQAALKARTGKYLLTRFKKPNISSALDDVVTYKINDDAELFGIFLAGWEYLHDQLEERTAPWIDAKVDSYIIEKTVNDLIEKSIRNFEIRERWKDVASD